MNKSRNGYVNAKSGKSVPLTTGLVMAVIMTGVPAAEPMVRQGSDCPPGYYRSGAYCIPASERTKPAITREGANCPPYYYRSGDYCVPSKTDVEPPLVRQGDSCPPHYYRSGDYCIKGR